jgi:Cu+-exporting ATPase
VQLEVGGMTCAACAARVEKRLKRMPGVQASVNFALEASVDFPSGTSVADLVRTVEATGYTASPAKLQPSPRAHSSADAPPLVAARSG